jgi:ribosomal protein S27AE
MIELSIGTPSIAIKLIDAATSYKIKGADFIDNRMWSCPKCGWWKLAIHQADSKCKRCGSECKIDFWDGIIRLLAQTRSGQYMFPAGLLETVERVLKKSGYEYEVINDSPETQPHENLSDLRWVGWELRQHQQEAVDEAINSLDSGYGAILHMPTGSGKTVTALKLIQMKKQRTLIIVHKLNLLKQWQKEIKSMLDYDAGVWGGGEKYERDITIAMIQSMGDLNINRFNFVLVDECLDGNTYIETEIGKIKIRDIVENEMNIKVKTHTGKFKSIKQYHKIKTIKPMVCVGYETGEIKCTEDHKFMTPRGWVRAKDLLPGRDMVYQYAKKKDDIQM